MSQTLTLILEGITADDYLQWIRDPDPPRHGALKLTSVRSGPLGDRIHVGVSSDSEVPPAEVAAHLLGFPITADVAAVRARFEHASA